MESHPDYRSSPNESSNSLSASGSHSNRSSSSSSRVAPGRPGRDGGGIGKKVAQGVSRAFESLGWGQQQTPQPSREEVNLPRSDHEQYQPGRNQRQQEQEQQRQPRQHQQRQNQSHRRSYTSIFLRPPSLPVLSKYSTPAVPDSGWASHDFMLGVGMVIIQEQTHRIVTVYEKEHRVWFFPRGRKDVGETLEQAALREGYEESGYTPEFMPHHGPMHQPRPPSHTADQYAEPTCEPIYITIMHWSAQTRVRDGKTYTKPGGEYLITWFLGKIPSDAVRQLGTGMEDEQNYEASLLTYEDALARLPNDEKKVLTYAWDVYRTTLDVQDYLARQRLQRHQEAQDSASNNHQQENSQHRVGIPEIPSDDEEKVRLDSERRAEER